LVVKREGEVDVDVRERSEMVWFGTSTTVQLGVGRRSLLELVHCAYGVFMRYIVLLDCGGACIRTF
jgi:hypothetical protein